ncbi:MAG: PorV/PorQ family protein [Flavobacteriales bacterium]|nr:PorV/PorQ family protein [Flavobacteriales bacterium]
MKNLKYTFLLSLVCTIAWAGNRDRVGQAGASELLINPWAQSSGMASAGLASTNGLEAMNLNVAGLTKINKTELLFSRTDWLRGSDININAFGLAQKLGESGALGIGIMSMSFGDIPVTTVNLPEGGKLGTFSPQYLNLGVSYARNFSDNISAGITVRMISEQIANANARGTSLDAGIRYVTGPLDRVKFGIALRNVGPKMEYAGDGFSIKANIEDEEFTLETRSQAFELPAVLAIGASYDFHLGMAGEEGAAEPTQIITAAGSFTSNSFGKDQIAIGAEYGFKKMVFVRAGYLYEDGVASSNAQDLTNAFSGPTAGLSLSMPFVKDGPRIGLDYSYRATKSFDGTHSIGLRINI